MTPEQIEKDITEVTKVYKDKPRSDLIAALVIAGRSLETHKNINAALVSTLDRLWLFNNHLMSLLEKNNIKLSAEPTKEFVDLAKRELVIRTSWGHESRQFAVESDRKGRGKKAIEARHGKEGGSRDLKAKLRDIWATGKYLYRTTCAEEEYEGLGIKTYGTAYGYLEGTPDPDPWPAKEQERLAKQQAKGQKK